MKWLFAAGALALALIGYVGMGWGRHTFRCDICRYRTVNVDDMEFHERYGHVNKGTHHE